MAVKETIEKIAKETGISLGGVTKAYIIGVLFVDKEKGEKIKELYLKAAKESAKDSIKDKTKDEIERLLTFEELNLEETKLRIETIKQVLEGKK